jgi:hypothetical protein
VLPPSFSPGLIGTGKTETMLSVHVIFVLWFIWSVNESVRAVRVWDKTIR